LWAAIAVYDRGTIRTRERRHGRSAIDLMR